MKTKWLIIDGSNLLHCDPDLGSFRSQSLSSARRRLTNKISSASSHLANRITLLFDGAPSGELRNWECNPKLDVKIPSSSSADAAIEELVSRSPVPADITVVTSDRTESDTVRGCGARVVSCRDFLRHFLAPTERKLRESHDKNRPSFSNKIGDYFP